MGQLVFQATLGGQVNLVGPNTASTFNLNVPAVSSTIASLAAQTFAGAQTFTLDASISGLTVGKGGGAVSTNTAVGASALNATNTGGKCTAFGYQALTLTTGKENTAFGSSAGASMTSGEGLAAFGWNAANLNTGDNNTAIGHNSLGSNTTAANNTAIGNAALNANTTGASNVAVGRQALVANTTASSNTAVGYQAGYTNTTGANNTAVGYQALYGSTVTGGNNTAVGRGAGAGITAATDCVLLGDSAGNTITSGGGQTIIGSQAQAASATSPFGIVIGYNVTGQASGDYVTMGRSGAGKIYNQYSANATWTQTSDGRLKKNIQEETLGLSFINRLRPVKYEWKASNELDQSNPYYSETNERATGITMHGLIAQEVKEALDAEGVNTFNGWDMGLDGIQSISREMFVSPLIKAIQELKAELDTVKAKLVALKG